jgi:methyl coenzyme M reductase subunit C-like uncharacterized protein (methanogenesis marker protein 7)
MFFDHAELKKLYKKIKKLDEDKAWKFAMNPKVKREIIWMNTIDQLYRKGIDSEGRSFGDYSPYTVEYKIDTNQRFDHITLNDSGRFYNSFFVTVQLDGFTIDAEDTAGYDEPLFKVWGVDVAGLTDENLAKLREMIIENYITYWENVLSVN